MELFFNKHVLDVKLHFKYKEMECKKIECKKIKCSNIGCMVCQRRCGNFFCYFFSGRMCMP